MYKPDYIFTVDPGKNLGIVSFPQEKFSHYSELIELSNYEEVKEEILKKLEHLKHLKVVEKKEVLFLDSTKILLVYH